MLFIARSGKTAANEQQQPNLRNQLCFRMSFCPAPRSNSAICRVARYLIHTPTRHFHVLCLYDRFCCNPASLPYPQSLSVIVRRSLMSKLSKTAPRAIREWRNSLRRPNSYPDLNIGIIHLISATATNVRYGVQYFRRAERVVGIIPFYLFLGKVIFCKRVSTNLKHHLQPVRQLSASSAVKAHLYCLALVMIAFGRWHSLV